MDSVSMGRVGQITFCLIDNASKYIYNKRTLWETLQEKFGAKQN